MSCLNGVANIVDDDDVPIFYSRPVLFSSTFRFSADRVSQSAATSAMPIFDGVTWHCRVHRMGQHLCVIVDGVRSCQVDVRVTIVNEDPSRSISRSATSFRSQLWDKFAAWNQLLEPGFISSDDSIVVELTIGWADSARGGLSQAKTVAAASKSDNLGHIATTSSKDYALNSSDKAGSGTRNEKRRETDCSHISDKEKRDANAETNRVRSDNVKRSVSEILSKYSLSKYTYDGDEDSDCADSVERETNGEHSDSGGIDGAASFNTNGDYEPTAKKVKIDTPQKHFAHQAVQTENEELFSSTLDVTKALECQVCYSLLEPPIALCCTGHSLCGRCRDGVQSCPSCAAAFVDNMRNFTLESVMDYVLYPCKSGECDAKSTISNRASHELDCRKRMYICASVFDDKLCDWEGPIDAFAKHVRTTHPVTYLTERKLSDIVTTMTVADDDFPQIFFLNFENNIFAISFSKDGDNYYGCVRMFGTQTEAKPFKCHIVLASKISSIDYRLSSSFQVHSDLEKQHRKCISLSTLGVIKENGLIDGDGNFVISVCLFKK